MKYKEMDPVRASMTGLPWFLQGLLTWLTGKALPGQKPVFRNTWQTQLATGFGLVLLGAGLSGWAAAGGMPIWGLLALPILWLMTVSGARFLQTNILHQASHTRLTGDAERDRRIGNVTAALVLVPAYDQYKAAHMPHHTPGQFATVNDPDFRFFRRLGFEPGLSMIALWQRLWQALFGWKAHAEYLRVRLRANFVKAGCGQRLLAGALQGIIAAVFLVSGGIASYLLGWVIPMTILFQISAILQYLTEHQWLLQRTPGEAAVVYLNRLTTARFMGEMAPAPGAGVGTWAAWWTRMLTYHLFCRVFIVQGPLVVHDFHHREPLHPRWPSSVYERQGQIDSGSARFADYAGVWGFHNALRLSLRAISEAPALAAQPGLSEEEVEEGFRSM